MSNFPLYDIFFCSELMGKALFFSQSKARFQFRAVNKPRPNERNTFFNATYHNIARVLATFVTCCNMFRVIGSSKKTLYSWSGIDLICEQCLTISKVCSFSIISYYLYWLNLQKSWNRSSSLFACYSKNTFLLSRCLQLSTNLGKYFFRSLLCLYSTTILPTL